MAAIKYVLVRVDELTLTTSTLVAVNTPRALGIKARDYPGAKPFVRWGYGSQFGSPYRFVPLQARPRAHIEYQQAKNEKA